MAGIFAVRKCPPNKRAALAQLPSSPRHLRRVVGRQAADLGWPWPLLVRPGQDSAAHRQCNSLEVQTPPTEVSLSCDDGPARGVYLPAIPLLVIDNGAPPKVVILIFDPDKPAGLHELQAVAWMVYDISHVLCIEVDLVA